MINSKNCFNYLILARDILPRSEVRNKISYFISYTQNNYNKSKSKLDVNEFVWRSRVQSENGNLRNKS